jgi:hypothetical protein
VVATILLVLGSLAAFVAVPAAWADRAMSTTEFRSTVRTISEDPQLQLTIADQVTTALMERVDVTGNLNEVLDDLQEAPIGRSLIDDLRNLVKLSDAAGRALVQQRIQNALATTAATGVWEALARNAQAVIVTERSEPATAISVNIAPVIEEIKQQLVADGLTAASSIQPGQTSVVLVRAPLVENARTWYSRVHLAGTYGPFVAAAFMLLALIAAVRRMRTLVAAALGVAIAMIALIIGTTIGSDLAPRSVGAVVYDAVAESFRPTALAVLGISLLVAGVAASIAWIRSD